MNASAASQQQFTARRWLSLVLAVLVLSTGVTGAVHAADLGDHDAGEVCQTCANLGSDDDALPAGGVSVEPGPDYHPAIIPGECGHPQADRGDAQPRAPPA